MIEHMGKISGIGSIDGPTYMEAEIRANRIFGAPTQEEFKAVVLFGKDAEKLKGLI